MATYDEIVASTQLIKDNLVSMDLKLDDIKALIDSLSGGGIITQQQLDDLGALVDSVKAQSDANKAEADGLVP